MTKIALSPIIKTRAISLAMSSEGMKLLCQKNKTKNMAKGNVKKTMTNSFFGHCYRSDRRRREIIPLDKWEILPEQIEYKEELGRGAFGVVYKAILKKRQGIEVFDSREVVEPAKESNQVVAVKKLQGARFAMIFVVDYQGVWVL